MEEMIRKRQIGKQRYVAPLQGRRREEQRDILALAPVHTACNIDVLAILM